MTEPSGSRIAAARARVHAGPINPLEKRMSKFLREPPSIRLAASVIVTATGLVVVGAALLMRVLDHDEYPTIWIGIWWALQTVTTVGYGDVTPHNTTGRVIAGFVMLEGIAFLSIITAAITSTFVARAAREQAAADEEQELVFNERFDELDQRLERIESLLRDRAPAGD